MISKRYVDIFEQCIYKGESTSLSLGTLVICMFCFVLILVSTFTQFTFSYPCLTSDSVEGLHFVMKKVAYSPQVISMMFVIYLLGRKYSFLIFVVYLLLGFFVWPIFVFGGGLGYIQNYLFGYFLGFCVAIFVSGFLLGINQSIKVRLLAGLLGVISIHICGFLYCIILAIFRVINFGLIFPIFQANSIHKILYDIIFVLLLFLVAPYIKSVFWICMKPKNNRRKQQLKNAGKRA